MEDPNDFWFEPIEGIYMRSSDGRWIDINTEALKEKPSFFQKFKNFISAFLGYLKDD
mgnify:CR=1 FL=1|tara:strand:- start:1347 stop:1517 length:171 start_codon:yes stop_codon:yes gene_type:complete